MAPGAAPGLPRRARAPSATVCSIKGPAAHVGKALPFGEIRLTSLQLLGASVELLFGTFVILDVHARSIPLEDLSMFVTERHFAVQHPAIFPIRPSHARFIFEDFPTCQAGTPPVDNARNVVGMN